MKGNRLTHQTRCGILAALMAGMFSMIPVVQAMPAGGTVVDGSANIGTPVTVEGIKTMNINSSSGNNLITWQSFSIGNKEKVAFDHNNYLNYVTGSTRSDILGELTGTGNGQIYLVNPHGILIGDDAKIDVGSLHLSTDELSGAALTSFTNATGALSGAVNLKGDVINKGDLHASAITVQGENITFKNVTKVDSPSVELTAVANGTVTPQKASGEIHLGYTDEDGDYTTVIEPELTGWTLNGAVDKYMLVKNADELQAMNNNLSGKYMLANDIVLEVKEEGEYNFIPIGGQSPCFTGKFDGLYHTIENLTIIADSSMGTQGAGLFGGVKSGGVVENIGLLNSNVKYTWQGAAVGGIVGEVTDGGVLRNAYNIGNVEGHPNSWSREAGGITGRITDPGSTVSNVFHRGNVSGLYAGGVTGMISGGATLTDAYHEGSITGTNGAGGVVGIIYSNSNISNVYNAGDVVVTTGNKIGGVLGERHSYSGAVLENCFHEAYYATTDAEGNPINQNVSTNNYSTAKTMEELTNADSYTDTSWSMDTDGSNSNATWRIYPGQTTPFLTAFMTPLEISGTTSYELSSAYTGEDILVGKGTNGDVTVRNVGEYVFTDLSSLYSNQQGYNIHVADGTTATMKYTVTPAALTVTAAAASKVYDGTTAVTVSPESYSVSGLLTNDTYTNPSIAFADKNVGTDKAVSISGGTLNDGNNGANYAITYIGNTGTITAKALTVDGSAINTTKVYDGTTAVNAQARLTLTGMAAGDDVYLDTANITAVYPNKDVGDYELTYSSDGAVSLAGTDAGNYTITGALADTAGTGSIRPKNLSLTFAPISKEYDGTVAAVPGQPELTGMLTGETVSLADGITAVYDSPDAGDRIVNYSGIALQGTDAANYWLADTAVGQGVITTPPPVESTVELVIETPTGPPLDSEIPIISPLIPPAAPEIFPPAAPALPPVQPADLPVAAPVPPVPGPAPDSQDVPPVLDWRKNMPMMWSGMAYGGASIYSNVGSDNGNHMDKARSQKDTQQYEPFKRRPLAGGIDFYKSNTQFNLFSQGINAPLTMSFADILNMWASIK